METTAQRKARRAREKDARVNGPPGYRPWVARQPCARCGRHGGHTGYGVHHDPTVARGGTWRDTSKLCDDCHTLAPDSRHRHPKGHRGFWGDMGTTREAVNADFQRRYAAEPLQHDSEDR